MRQFYFYDKEMKPTTEENAVWFNSTRSSEGIVLESVWGKVKKASEELNKDKTYIKPGENPPAGVSILIGPRGGRYFEGGTPGVEPLISEPQLTPEDADRWMHETSSKINTLKQENERILAGAGTYERFKRGVREGQISEAGFKEFQAKGVLISDEDYAKALEVRKKIDEIADTPMTPSEPPKAEPPKAEEPKPEPPKAEQPTAPTEQTPEKAMGPGSKKFRETLLEKGVTKPTDLIYNDRQHLSVYLNELNKIERREAEINAYSTIKSLGRDDFIAALKAFKVEYDTTKTSPEDVKKLRQTAYFLGGLGSTIRGYSRMQDVDKVALINEIREDLDNDIKQTNTVLKFMGFKDRVTKAGFKNSAVVKTAEEIASSLKEVEYEGIKFKISPTYVKNSETFSNEKELTDAFKDVVSKLPPKAKASINKGETQVHFITRPEAKKIAARFSQRNSCGYYMPANKQIYIFPDRAAFFLTNLDAEGLKAHGYDDEFIAKVKRKEGAEAWKNVVTHELAHATALNEKNGFQEQYGREMSDYFTSNYKGMNVRSELKPSFISDYAMTNSHEDFAETAAFYARDREFIDKELEMGDKSILHPLLRKKFEFLVDSDIQVFVDDMPHVIRTMIGVIAHPYLLAVCENQWVEAEGLRRWAWGEIRAEIDRLAAD